MGILQTIDLKKHYGIEPNITHALDGVSLSVEQGEFIAVVGTSGSGKSTLLNMVGGLDTPISGSVIVRGEELAKKNDEELIVFRRRNIGFIFQNYNLVPILNVYENIVLPVELDGGRIDRKFMDKVVQMLALGAGLAVKVSCRLIGKDNRWFGNQGAGNSHTLLLPAGHRFFQHTAIYQGWQHRLPNAGGFEANSGHRRREWGFRW